MFNSFIHHVHIDESRLKTKTCTFDLERGDYEDHYRMTNVRDASLSFSSSIPTGLTAEIDYVTDRVLHVQVHWIPERYSDEWLIEKFNVVWGTLWAVGCSVLIVFTEDASLVFLLFPIVFTPLWFGQFYFVKKRATKRYARDLAHGAYPRILEMKVDHNKLS